MTDDPYDLLARAVQVIREDEQLKQSFNRVLGIGSMTQQVRVSTLLQEIEALGAPQHLEQFVRLLGNDQLAHTVLRLIND